MTPTVTRFNTVLHQIYSGQKIDIVKNSLFDSSNFVSVTATKTGVFLTMHVKSD